MQEIKLTPTREDALEFAGYLAEHPQPEPITIPLAALYELAERAQIRAEVVKIVAETNQIADERIDWQAICEQHDPQLDGLRMDIARGLERAARDAEQLPIMTRFRRIALATLVFVGGFVAIIETVVHFAQKWGLPW
jgi:hypothetical protein